MADEMLFTVAGAVAMPAQTISLEEAGLEARADLQEWVLANPGILGPAVKVVTFEFDGMATAVSASPDRVNVLGLGADGRLVVAEVKSSRAPDTDVVAAKYAAMVSRLMPESLAEHYARFRARQQAPLTPDEALAELQAHAPDLSLETLRRPRVVLLAPDFSPALTASVVWLNEMGLDVSLIQITAFRSFVYGQLGSTSVPMISVSQIYPVRQVEEFVISPERQRAKEIADAKRRVQDASTVRRLVNAELVADGTMFTISPPGDLGLEIRSELEEWLNADPARRTAYWQNELNGPLVWDVDKAAYTPAALVRHIVEQATGLSQDHFGTQWWRDPTGWTLVELAGPSSGGRGALYREFWSRWLQTVRAQHPDWTQMTVLPAQNFVTLPSPVRGTHFTLAFVAGGRLRSDLFIDFGTTERSTAQFDMLQSQQADVEALYGRPLSWERLPDRGAYRVADYGEGEITNQADYPFYIDWMVDAQERLRRALADILHGGGPGSFGFERR